MKNTRSDDKESELHVKAKVYRAAEEEMSILIHTVCMYMYIHVPAGTCIRKWSLSNF